MSQSISDFCKTVDLLSRAGLRTQSLDLSTITYWLDRGYTPQRIAHKIYSVPADVLADILATAEEEEVRISIPVA